MPKKSKPIKRRNAFALHSMQRKAGPMKSKLKPVDVKYEHQELLDENLCFGCDKYEQKYGDGLCERCHKLTLKLE